MKQTVYCKFNQSRCPAYATKTSILEENGRKTVLKTAMTEEGRAHIRSFADKSAQLQRLYQQVHVLEVAVRDDCAIFPFVEGHTIASRIEEQLPHPQKAIETMKEWLAKIEDYSSEFVTPFVPSEAFSKVFGEVEYRGDAVTAANVDEIFDNFLLTGDGLTLIDYEWVFDFAVPVDYIRFRTVYYFYVKNHSILSQTWDEGVYLKEFGFSLSETALWKQMDERFQQYVHGRNRRYYYTPHYEGAIHDINYLLNHVSDIGKEFTNLHRISDQYDELVPQLRQLYYDIQLKHYPGYLKKRLQKKLSRKKSE